jgi:hypothetical protein
MFIHLSLKRAATLALAIGAVSAGPASAMPAQQTAAVQATSAPQVIAVPDAVGRLSARLAHGYGEHLSPVTSTASYGFTTHPRIVTSGAPSDSGFNWGDAGIGAAGGLALSLLGLGGAVAVTRRRPRHAAGRQISPATTL